MLVVNSESEMDDDEAAELLLQIQNDEVLPRQKFQAHAQLTEAPPTHEFQQFKSKLAGLDFPNKVYEVVDYPPLDYCIRWNAEGTGLQIVSDAEFRKVALHLLCHGSFSSLTRQLQAYGFKKNTKSRCKHEYSHEKGYFLRAQKQKLKKICRKPPQGSGKTTAAEDLWLNVEGRLTSLEAKMTCLQAMSNIEGWGIDQWLRVEGRQTSLEAKMTSLDSKSDQIISEIVAIRQFVQSRADATWLVEEGNGRVHDDLSLTMMP